MNRTESSLVRITACVLAIFWMPTPASAQIWSGSYVGSIQGGGSFTVNWSFSIRRGAFCHLYFLEGFEPVIEGPDVELVREGEEESSEVEQVREYRVLDYARDLMSGRFLSDLERINQNVLDAGLEPIGHLSRTEMINEAVAAYGRHLQDHPDDWLVVREMGVALLAAGRSEDAMDMVHEAYLNNPELGILPLNRSILGESEEGLRGLVIRAVQHTNRNPRAKGWLLVAALMQAQGRVELAGEMIGRAEGLGLEQTVVEGFRESLP